jgi:DNA-binding beta-propeller fold protein YncE
MKTAHRNTNNKRFALGKTLTATLCLTIALLALPAYAVTNELVGSAESHSIEKFDSTGNWIKTFASTGPYYPVGIAVSPLTGDVFATTLTDTILRYTKGGTPLGQSGSFWDTFNTVAVTAGNPPEALLFDANGNLYVATGEVYTEAVAGVGPMNQLATGTVQPAEVGFLAVDSSGNLYLPEWHNVAARYGGAAPYFCTYYSCQDYDVTSDMVYEINPTSGAQFNFVKYRLWGPYQMIFVPF